MNDRTTGHEAHGAFGPSPGSDGQMHRVTSPIAPLLAEPRAAATQTSQYLNGRHLRVLEARGEWLRVRGGDAYEGWMHRGYLRASVDRSHDEHISLGCIARATRGGMRALPLGALLDEDETAVAGDSVRVAHLSSHFPAGGSAIAESAVRLFEGTSYVWGGVTPWGADCSGFVQSVYALHGISLPRDAADQALCGVEVDSDAESLVVADLLFFSDRSDARVTHVAIAIGEGRIVHIALGRGGYAIEALRGQADDYAMGLRGRIRFARRVIGVAPLRTAAD